MMVVLLFSCNFNVVLGGAEHSIYLLCHLDWKPRTTHFVDACTRWKDYLLLFSSFIWCYVDFKFIYLLLCLNYSNVIGFQSYGSLNIPGKKEKF